MPSAPNSQPRSVPQVMVSSTFTDLEAHRNALISALHTHDLHACAMENDSARPDGDVIDSSLQMVRDSAAYILLIGFKYGQTPICPLRNPEGRSITELEFDEAQRLGRPTLLFIMGDEHPVRKADIERDDHKEELLNAFRERAKEATPGGANRVYATFNSLDEFKDKLGSSLKELGQLLAEPEPSTVVFTLYGSKPQAIPPAPLMYAEPDYIGSHEFIGRRAELEALDDWANAADPTNLLLFEAIGGNGKSILTWEWTTKRATEIRTDWAGRFWYSFYERGAIMADFCQHALAYVTGRPLEEFRKRKTTAMKEELLAHLQAKPWLFILDGLERVLVAYHRIDAASVMDEEANNPTDIIAERNPTAAIRDEDDDLLRALAAAAPSKILVSTRLTPRVLLNPSAQPIPGVKRITLPGLRPTDAEALLRSCGVTGDSAAIRSYLQTNCDNHPLVIGILGGLIQHYLPDRGNFDAWASDAAYGAKLNLADLDLVGRRNHILRAAMADLDDASQQLLSTMALLSDSVEYATLLAFNPHLPPELEEMEEPNDPEKSWRWKRYSEEEKKQRIDTYQKELVNWQEYQEKVRLRLASEADQTAPRKLTQTILDLEQRGLLQYDKMSHRYDLHPVVRGVASGNMSPESQQLYGQKVIDHFSSVAENPYDEAETMEDLRPGLHIVQTLIKLERWEQAADTLQGDFGNSLFFNLEAYTEFLSLIRPFFPFGWIRLPENVSRRNAGFLANDAGIALDKLNEPELAFIAGTTALAESLESGNWYSATTRLRNLHVALINRNRFAGASRTIKMALDLAQETNDEDLFIGSLFLYYLAARIGQWNLANKSWQKLSEMKGNWSRSTYRPGMLEFGSAIFKYWQGRLKEADLITTEQIAKEGKNRFTIRAITQLRGIWCLEQNNWTTAVYNFAKALRMAREVGLSDVSSETGLALAKYKLDQLSNPHQEAERLAQLREPAHYYLALLWRELGEIPKAQYHALAAYKKAWADGEPYVHRYNLTKATELLNELGEPIPDLPPYDPANDPPFPWEADVLAVIEKLRAEKAKEEE